MIDFNFWRELPKHLFLKTKVVETDAFLTCVFCIQKCLCIKNTLMDCTICCHYILTRTHTCAGLYTICAACPWRGDSHHLLTCVMGRCCHIFAAGIHFHRSIGAAIGQLRQRECAGHDGCKQHIGGKYHGIHSIPDHNLERRSLHSFDDVHICAHSN